MEIINNRKGNNIMSETIILALISGIVTTACAAIAIIPVIKSNNKKTVDEIKAEVSGKVKDEVKEAVDDGIRGVKEQVETLQKSFDSHRQADDEYKATQWRVYILNFDDNLRNYYTPFPTQGAFIQARSFADKYKHYLDTHEDFENGIAEDAIANIVEKDRYCRENSLYGQPK